jgi:hypothetical protein
MEGVPSLLMCPNAAKSCLLGHLDEAEAEMERILRDAPGYADATRAKQLYAAARQRMQPKDRL